MAITRSGLPEPLTVLSGDHHGAGGRQLIEIAQARQSEFAAAYFISSTTILSTASRAEAGSLSTVP